MYLSIHGFLVDFDKDDSLKFELDLDLALHEELAQLIGHRCHHAMAERDWLLKSDRIAALLQDSESYCLGIWTCSSASQPERQIACNSVGFRQTGRA
jgi:hypothetical protein